MITIELIQITEKLDISEVLRKELFDQYTPHINFISNGQITYKSFSYVMHHWNLNPFQLFEYNLQA